MKATPHFTKNHLPFPRPPVFATCFAEATKVRKAATGRPDDKTIIAGNFTQVLGVTRNCVARFNTDGTLDMTFDPNA